MMGMITWHTAIQHNDLALQHAFQLVLLLTLRQPLQWLLLLMQVLQFTTSLIVPFLIEIRTLHLHTCHVYALACDLPLLHSTFLFWPLCLLLYQQRVRSFMICQLPKSATTNWMQHELVQSKICTSLIPIVQVIFWILLLQLDRTNGMCTGNSSQLLASTCKLSPLQLDNILINIVHYLISITFISNRMTELTSN